MRTCARAPPTGVGDGPRRSGGGRPRRASVPARVETVDHVPRRESAWKTGPTHEVPSPPMRILMVTWEFPPLVIGGLAVHVDGLSRALVRQATRSSCSRCTTPTCGDDYDHEGVRVLRARADLPWLPPENFVAQMASANHRLVQLSRALDGWAPDVVHAHDWLVAWAGDTLHELYGVPLVATVHATERGRNGGHVPPGQPAAIHAVEWWLTYQANRVIACSPLHGRRDRGRLRPAHRQDRRGAQRRRPRRVGAAVTGPGARRGTDRSWSRGVACSTRRASRPHRGHGLPAHGACPASTS